MSVSTDISQLRQRPVRACDDRDAAWQSAARPVRSLFLSGPAGRLEALLNEGLASASCSALVCHPHPLGAGTMHNKVVYHAAKVFSSLGWPVLRFNFRGAGLSEGEHDGSNEVEDAAAALDWLAAQYDRPIVAAGFSFGAAMGLEAATACSSALGFAALGLPTRSEDRDYVYPHIADAAFPKLFLSGDRDGYAPVDELRRVVGCAREPKRLVLIPGADHFFTGHVSSMQSELGVWLKTAFPTFPEFDRASPLP